MITFTYVISGVLLLGTAWLFSAGVLTAVTMTACWCVMLFFASAGASSAYLTVSEIFPMETRALAAGLVEAWLGIRAERKGLEELATPLSAEDAAEPARV